jgi:anti-sigma factor ChrR (cupin superfamily)
MRINADLNERVVIETEGMDWVASPAAGVERRMLDRDGAESGRATTIVRFAPGSEFPPHDHPGGEEFLVLAGTFSDETGDFGPGTYVRNPVGSRHKPASREGCTILVKLCQMNPADQAEVRIDTNAVPWHAPEGVDGVEYLVLHEFGTEKVVMVRLGASAPAIPHDHPGGEEIFVVEGSLIDEHGRYPKGTWLRAPSGSVHSPYTDEGCVLWVKSGHLPG